jgi:hypothetical protein
MIRFQSIKYPLKKNKKKVLVKFWDVEKPRKFARSKKRMRYRLKEQKFFIWFFDLINIFIFCL